MGSAIGLLYYAVLLVILFFVIAYAVSFGIRLAVRKMTEEERDAISRHFKE